MAREIKATNISLEKDWVTPYVLYAMFNGSSSVDWGSNNVRRFRKLVLKGLDPGCDGCYIMWGYAPWILGHVCPFCFRTYDEVVNV